MFRAHNWTVFIVVLLYRKFCGLVGQHVSLDIEYIELIPKMYSNEMSQVISYVSFVVNRL